MDNPRFPHTCKIYRVTGETSFSDGIEEVLYEGECRKYISKKATGSEVLISEYALSIPAYKKDEQGNNVRIVVKALAGDAVNVVDKIGSFSGKVVECSACNLGNTIYWNHGKN